MRIIQITPGTGNFHCGCSIRDGALLLELRRRGHDVTCLPLYLPLVTEDGTFTDAPIFFSALSVYLEQKFPFMRRMPRFVDRMLSHPRLLKAVASRADMTSASEHGDMTVSMLRGEQGFQAREIEKLIQWLQANESPDLIVLSMSLLAGSARRLREALDVPVISSLQGEDAFLDSLPGDIQKEAWALLSKRLGELDGLIAPSHFYSDLMHTRTAVPQERIHTVYNGIDLTGYLPRETVPTPFRIGFLSHICDAKGLSELVDAFIYFQKRSSDTSSQLVVIGAMTAHDKRAFAPHRKRLEDHGLWNDVELHRNVSKKQKQDLLRTLSVLSVPATFDEAFGLYMAEAMASAVPLVQPDRGAFTELIQASGGGVLYEPGNAHALADQWYALLNDPERNIALGQKGRNFALQEFDVGTMAQHSADTYQAICDAYAADR